MKTQEQELKSLLIGQDFDSPGCFSAVPEQYKDLARAYVRTENGIAVLSDFRENRSYIFAGKFGAAVGLEDVAYSPVISTMTSLWIPDIV